MSADLKEEGKTHATPWDKFILFSKLTKFEFWHVVWKRSSIVLGCWIFYIWLSSSRLLEFTGLRLLTNRYMNLLLQVLKSFCMQIAIRWAVISGMFLDSIHHDI